MKKVDIIKRGDLGVLVIKNPPYNTLSIPVFMDLRAGLEDLKKDNSIRVMVITGQGLFSVGADVKEIYQFAMQGDQKKVRQLVDTAALIIEIIENAGKPVIAAIDGFCLGGGNELSMACTARVATDQAQFGQPEIKLGMIPGLGGTQRLPRLIGVKRALEMMALGNFIMAVDAKKLGLVDLVVPQKNLISKTKDFAQNLLTQPLKREKQTLDPAEVDKIIASETFQNLMKTKSQDAINALLKVMKEGIVLPLPEALELEREICSNLMVSPDAMEGLMAFVEKRQADFPSRGGSGAQKAEREKKTEVPAVSDEGADQGDLEILRETVAHFARNEIAPRVEEMEKEGRIFPDIIKKMAELGFFGVYFPEKYGGSNFGKAGYCILLEEISRVHASTAVLIGASLGLACTSIYLSGNESQKQKYLKQAVEGKMIGAFALTEAGAGSDAAAVRTSAEKKDDQWILNGTKQFISNGDIADFIVVIAQTDPFLGVQGLVSFIVETAWPGFSVTGSETKIGIKASSTNSIAFDNMEVPEENMLGGIGDGFKIFMQALNGGRLGLAAGCLGAAREAFKLAYEYASQRIQFNKSLIEQEAIQFYFAEMKAKIYLMESVVKRTAEMADRGFDYRQEAAIVKLTCSEMCCEVIDLALQIFGGYGYCEEYPIARMYRDARINRIFEGTNEIQKLMIFKEIFKSGGKI